MGCAMPSPSLDLFIPLPLQMIILLIIGVEAWVGVRAQDCQSVSIDAIVPCSFSFNTSSSCGFESCVVDHIDQSITYSSWSSCYEFCCPGVVVPASEDRQALQ